MVSLALLLTPFVVMLLVGELMPGVVAHDAVKKDHKNHKVDRIRKDDKPPVYGMDDESLAHGKNAVKGNQGNKDDNLHAPSYGSQDKYGVYVVMKEGHVTGRSVM